MIFNLALKTSWDFEKVIFYTECMKYIITYYKTKLIFKFAK